ncbi:PhzF family phenazine biosynthesis protein [Caulobacter sp. NIBR2454]|uniref:PhzF family phenazine biosynthesis protein n=1 Tax=Caulobacter sp. NIBR2454 TaxID=3015996 RepID=UPI0022B5F818|nr:PhzF family phenazine biosynthesis protein [Caulobacter sp. NIBR2454]
MSDVSVHVVQAFVEADGQGGNPAGVVIDMDRALSPEQRLAVAGMAGFSETAFISRSEVSAFRLEFFTPTRQIAHCGHATVASFGLLAQQGLAAGESSKETIDGPRRILVDDGRAYMQQLRPTYRQAGEADFTDVKVLASISLTEADVDGRGAILAHNGNGTLLLGVKDREVLRRLRPDQAAISEITERVEAVCLYVFALDAMKEGRAATCRMFAPAYGIDEEAATGMAAGALGAWMQDGLGVDRSPLLIEQGWFMDAPSPSLIEVRLSPDEVLVGGRAAVRETLTVQI